MSGRFRTEKLLSTFSSENSEFCQLHHDDSAVGDLVHHLVLCPVLEERRLLLFEYWKSIAEQNPPIREIVQHVLTSTTEVLMQFILDCSVLPLVISATQQFGFEVLAVLFKITRTYCYSIHRERMKILELWK